MNVSSNLVVYEKVIAAHVNSELPFMATENILMEEVKLGGDRQELHEKIRVHSMEAAKRVKEEGLNNDLIERLIKDETFKINEETSKELLDAKKFTGRAENQVVDFITELINPILEENKNLLGENSEITV